MTFTILKTLENYLTLRNHRRVRGSDGANYYVVDRNGWQAAAEILVKTRAGLLRLLDELDTKRKHQELPPTLESQILRLLRQFPQGRGIQLYEIDATVDESLAYTRNKTEGFFLCLRDKHGVLASPDSVLFLALHEFAHSAIPFYDPQRNGQTVHSEAFKQLEMYFYEIAKELQLLDPSTLPGRRHCNAILVDPRSAM